MALWDNCTPNLKVFLNLEEQVIIDHTLEVDTCRFQLNLDMLQDIANKLYVDWGAGPIGKNWLLNFIQYINVLRIYINWKYDYQRALNANPEII